MDRDTLLKRMEEHINTVMKRYKDSVYCWDVVNEAVEDTGEEVLRQKSHWREIIGDDLLKKHLSLHMLPILTPFCFTTIITKASR